jgi:hypothetical protein
MFSNRWELHFAPLAVVAALACFLVASPTTVADSKVSFQGTLVALSDTSAASAAPALPAAGAVTSAASAVPAKPKVVLPPGVVARVNGQDITRAELADRTFKSFGEQALVTMVQQAAIRQEAKALGVTTTKEDLDQAEDKFYGDPHNFPPGTPPADRKELWLKRLKSHGQTIESFRHDLEVEKLVEKMVSRRITITDDDVHAAYDKYFGKGSPGEGTKFETVKPGLTDRLIKERTPAMRNQVLNEIMKKADIQTGDLVPQENQENKGK